MSDTPKKKSARMEDRAQIIPGEIRGLITHPEKSDQYPFLIWDVSETGIGIWTPNELDLNREIVLTVGQPYLLVLNCEVSWCEKTKDNQGYRCGLKVLNNNKVFSSLLKAFTSMSREEEQQVS